MSSLIPIIYPLLNRAAGGSGNKPGTVDERMEQLEAYSVRYGKKIWFTEFAMAMETNETKGPAINDVNTINGAKSRLLYGTVHK